VEQLSVDALRIISAHCPLLFEVVRKGVVSDVYTQALAESGVKSVGFPGIRANSYDYYAFVNLIGIKLWDIGSGQEEVIQDLCAMSPNLKVLDLHFTARPDLSVIPCALAEVPRLQRLSLYAVPPDGVRDGNVSGMVDAMAGKLCPGVVIDRMEL
jgi:hypothetical protein